MNAEFYPFESLHVEHGLIKRNLCWFVMVDGRRIGTIICRHNQAEAEFIAERVGLDAMAMRCIGETMERIVDARRHALALGGAR